jgi:hypothetical protein
MKIEDQGTGEPKGELRYPPIQFALRGCHRNQVAGHELSWQPAAHFPLPVLGRLSRA